MTTQEKIKNTELLVREYIQHLEMGFLPKVKKLYKITRLGKEYSKLEQIGDVTIRSHVAQVMDSERFTETLEKQLMEFVDAIEKDMHAVLYGDNE